MEDEQPARTLRQAAVGPALSPLHLVRPGHYWYTNLDALLPAHHYGVTRKLEGLFAENTEWLHIGLVGHAGTGKSTLVRQSMADLSGLGILPVYVNAEESFDQVDMTFADVVLVLVEAVVRTLVVEATTIPLDPRRLELVRAWFSDEVVAESHRQELVGELSTSAEAGVGLPALASAAAKIVGTLRSDNEYRSDIRRSVGRDPRALTANANELLDGVHDALAARKQRLCVVFDNLEKIHDRRQVAAAVLRRADDLRRLRCHAIYFMSPADQYAPPEHTRQIDQVFTPLVEVPVLPIRLSRDDPEDTLDEQALAAISAILSKRLVLEAIFSDPGDCIAAIARWSGGRLRDIIDLARQACEFAEFEPGSDRVTLTHINQAGRKLAARRLTVMTPSCWARAVDIHLDKQIDNRSEDALMLGHSLVLAYDGDPWWDVHPFILQDRRYARAATSP